MVPRLGHKHKQKLISFCATCASLTLSCSAQAPPLLFAPAPGSPTAVGSRPSDIAVADVNGDGKLDIVTTNSGGNDVTVLLGDGRGRFAAAPGSPFAGGTAPHLAALGDLNQDGNLDLALTSHDSNDLIVLLGNGRGGLAPAPGSPFPALRGSRPHNHGLALADVNQDGKLDVATSNQNDNSVSVLLGDGRADFAPALGSPFPVGRAPYPLALGDVNSDGKLDIVTPNVGGNNVTVLLGNGRGGFAEAANSPLAVASRPYFVALGDLNGGRQLDLVTTHDDISLITILLGDGKGSFREAPGSPVDARSRGFEVRLGDVNADGRMDLVTGTASHSVVVLLGDGSGGFRPAAGSPFPTGRGPWGVTLADVNHDGKLDILTANSESNDVTVLLSR